MGYEDIIERLARIEQLIAAQKEVLGVEECCALTGYSRQHMYRMTSGHRIPHYRRGGKVFFRRSEVEAWLTADKIKTDEELRIEASMRLGFRNKK